MSDAVDVTFYVPCLNEAENVGAVVEEVADAARRHGLTAEILVFDDGSTDGTGEVAQEALDRVEGSDLRTELIRRERSRGLGANFFAGAHRGRGEHYLLVNGDGSERPETLDAVLSRVGDADLVVTYFADGDQRGAARRGLSRLFTGAVNRLNGHRLRYYNGPVLHRRLDVVDLATDCRGFAYQAELLTRELDAGRRAVEVPMVNRQRDAGTTKAFAPSNLLSVARSLWRIHFRRFEAEDRSPVRWSAVAVLGLLVPLVLAAVLRLWALGEHDIRSDEIGLLLRLSQGPSLSEIYADHRAQFAQYRQMPIPRLAALAVTSVTPGLDIRSVRLASAVAGVLTVAAMWWLGFEVGGVTLAVLL
ncbi:MAG: glycosyltransferase family 2 protein, partial [Acidobacteriota bacterium]